MHEFGCTPAGRLMVTDGARVVAVKLTFAGVGSTLPFSSTARTKNVWVCQNLVDFSERLSAISLPNPAMSALTTKVESVTTVALGYEKRKKTRFLHRVDGHIGGSPERFRLGAFGFEDQGELFCASNEGFT